MAVMRCSSCFARGESYQVTVAATATEVTFTLVDPCCDVRNCRQLRAIAHSAYCGWAQMVNAALGTQTLSFVDSIGGCCDCPIVPAGDFFIENENMLMGFTGDFAAVPGALQNTTVTVTAPFTNQV